VWTPIRGRISMRLHFSIVIPLYNRAGEIVRAVASVLAQDFADYEVILVDDGSTDDGIARVRRAFSDPRITIVSHQRNRGVCPARNTGVAKASAEWVVLLDSDDELVPGGLGILSRYTEKAASGIGRIACSYRLDDGSLSLDSPPGGMHLDYAGFIQWTEAARRTQFNNCIRRRTFERVRFPDTRAYETIYHLDFAQHYDTWLLQDVVALEHSDARNRAPNLNLSQRAAKLLRDAPDYQRSMEMILARHGDALRRLAPRRWALYNRMLILLALVSGRRTHGWQHAVAYARESKWQWDVVAAIALSCLGRTPLAWVYCWSRMLQAKAL